jgi:hypothetical protein
MQAPQVGGARAAVSGLSDSTSAPDLQELLASSAYE